MLLDTHVALWFAAGIELSERVQNLIGEARNAGSASISAVTVWEVGNLKRKGRAEISLTLPDWVGRFADLEGFSFVDLTVEIVIEADALPGRMHGDPADRFLVATARHLDVPLLTRDKHILAYAKAGHVKAIAC